MSTFSGATTCVEPDGYWAAARARKFDYVKADLTSLEPAGEEAPGEEHAC